MSRHGRWGCSFNLLRRRASPDFREGLLEMTRAHAGALMVLGGNMSSSERQRLVDLAARNRLPGVYGLREYVDAGGLMSYGANRLNCFGAPRPTWTNPQRREARRPVPSSSRRV